MKDKIIRLFSAIAFGAAASMANAAGIDDATVQATPSEAYVQKVGDEHWHSRWRSHYRWGSGHHHGHDHHSRWRSHNRYGSGQHHGHDHHSRWRSHNRYGSGHHHGHDYHSRWRSHSRWGSGY
jgi:hypothetical protein